ncbi:SURF1 family protein [Streptomyces calidiresistens]|uniref:SURF1-like protein n=1 Tax=Streptomyces calidiresistens TaxID=1485586 RepID=A0A7W3T155_9ACTN|nr:SURF1 family protein [Streptomyces calidiresistens]MBB0229049.1 SURF1 family protein [Streptomyces calidiresistens]
MYRFLLSRQWVLLTLLAVLLIPLMIQAGFWQFHRHEGRVERNDLIAGNLHADPVPMDRLTAPGREAAEEDRYRAVTATGVFDTSGEVAVRQRTDPEGGYGYWVLTPLEQSDGVVVLVNRGWVRAGETPGELPEMPPPPGGEVTVTGRLMIDETTERTGIRDRSGLPEGMVMMINSEQRAAELGRPVLGGYLELTGIDPAPAEGTAAPRTLPTPNHTGIGAHLAYAFQWWLFAAFVPVGWVILFRREVRDRRSGGSGHSAPGRGRPAPAGPTPGPGGANDRGEESADRPAGAGHRG